MWAWIPWEKAMIPSLLSRCCNWVGITQKTVDLIDEIQNQYVRVQMKTPQSCAKVMLRAETYFLGMKHRLWKEKLSEMSLAKQIYKEQKEKGWQGLAKEVSEICQEVGIEDLNEHEVSKEKKNKAKAISAELLELSLKNKLEETGKTR